MTMEGTRAKSTREASVRAALPVISARAYIRVFRCCDLSHARHRRCSSPCAHSAGNSTVNSLPKLNPALVASTVPPCISTRSRTTARPMPRPPSMCARRSVHLHEHLEDARKLRWRDANARIANAHAGMFFEAFHGQRDFAAVGRIFRSVDQQVQEHLLEAGTVGVHPERIGGQVDNQTMAAPRAIRRNRVDGIFQDGSQIHVGQPQRILVPARECRDRAVPRCDDSSGPRDAR